MRPVVLVNPNRMKPVVAPLGLEYVARALEVEGFQVELLDLAFADDVNKAIEQFFARVEMPLAVGVTIRNTDDCYFASQDFTLAHTRGIIDKIRGGTSCPIVLGGTGFSVMPAAVLRYLEADLGIVGDGEWAFPELLKCLASGREYRHVPGLVFVQGNGICINPPEYYSLEKFPRFDRGLIDNPRYFREGGQAGIEAKRGCNRSCIYCADPLVKGRKVRVRQPSSVANEVEELLRMGIDSFHTCDSEFNIPPQHGLAVSQELARRKLGRKLRWYAYCAIALFSPELARAMRQAGCAGINFGMDSGDSRMLESLGRDYNVQDIRKAVETCKEANIAVMLDLLLGGPGETKDSLTHTIELVKELDPTCCGVAIGVRIYPGTRLAHMVRKQGPIEKNPNLKGNVYGNESFLKPIFYLSSEVGEEASDFVGKLVGEDERFFFARPDETERNYNYNDNSILVNAIRQGYRGAYWHILKKIRTANHAPEGQPAT